MTGEWRVIAQRILTGEFLSWDVPLVGATTTRELTGPGGVFGRIEPELLKETARDGRPLIEEWSTALYVEDAEQIRAGGIVTKIDNIGTAKSIEAPGFSTYPVGIPYADDYLPDGFEDPTTVFKKVWKYVQSFPDSDLGVKVTAPETWMLLSNGSGPFVMRSVEYRDCGDLLDSLAQTIPFDYIEQHTWDATRSSIDHALTVGFPRLGRKRNDLRFTDSSNVTAFASVGRDGVTYANDVFLYGAGTGSAMRKSRATVRDGRLRRCAVVPLASQAGQGYLDRRAAEELTRRQLVVDISEVTIQDHIDAPIASITPGDDVRVQVEIPWLGNQDLWLRVLSIDEAGDSPETAVLKTQRSDFFTYAAEKSPTGDKVAVQV